MNRREIFLLHMLNCAIHSTKPEPMEFLPEEWEKLLQDCMSQGIFAIVFPVVERLFQQGCVPAPISEKWRKSTLSAASSQIRRRMAFERTYASLIGAGAQILLFKGPVISELYPEETLRIAGDMDLLVYGSADTAGQVLKAKGYICQASPHEAVVLDYRKGDLHVELHKALFEETRAGYSCLFHKFLPLEGLWERHIIFKTGNGIEIATFCPEDHLCYLLCHMAKHFIYAGFGLRHLSDLTLFAQHYANDICWESFWAHIRLTGLEKFTCALFSICMEYLGLHETCIPLFPGKTGSSDHSELLEDILDAGIFGARTPIRIRARSMTGRITETENSKARLILRAAFPSVGYLKYQYPYLKKKPWLLPAAWTQRAYRFLGSAEKTKHKENTFRQASELCKHRLNLLREYGLIK